MIQNTQIDTKKHSLIEKDGHDESVHLTKGIYNWINDLNFEITVNIYYTAYIFKSVEGLTQMKR